MSRKLLFTCWALSVMALITGTLALVFGDFQSAVLAHLSAIYLLILTRKVDDGR